MPANREWTARLQVYFWRLCWITQQKCICDWHVMEGIPGFVTFFHFFPLTVNWHYLNVLVQYHWSCFVRLTNLILSNVSWFVFMCYDIFTEQIVFLSLYMNVTFQRLNKRHFLKEKIFSFLCSRGLQRTQEF